jgi:soluble lytic murein transglycosylase-like protein
LRRAALGLVFLAFLFLPQTAQASAPAWACPQRATGPTSVKALIRCVAPRVGVSTSMALFIANRESGYRPWARNPHSSASGVYQVVSGTWRGFVSRYRWGNKIGTSVFDGRANVILSLRAARRGGWGPWGF